MFEIYNVCCMSVYLDSATLAQSVERFTRNEKVAGSIPAGGLNLKVRKVSYCLSLRTFLMY